MTPIKIIPSVLARNTRAYELHQDWSPMWDRRGNAPLCINIASYDTYGDGFTKHSPAYCSQWQDLVDVCLSFTAEILADPQADEWRVLSSAILNQCHHNTIDFALSVKHREGKDQFYSLSLRKLTCSNKSNDRRFEKVTEYQNGTPQSAFGIIAPFGGNRDWLPRLFLAHDIQDAYERAGGGYVGTVDKIFKDLSTMPGDWRQAYHSFRYALEAVERLRQARSMMDCAMQNSKPAIETATSDACRGLTYNRCPTPHKQTKGTMRLNLSRDIGAIVRLPRTDIRGGWFAGHYDFASWQVVPAGRHQVRLQSLANRAIKRDIGSYQLRYWLEYDGPQSITRYQDADGTWRNH